MKWLKNNLIQVLLTIINVVLIIGLMIKSYEVPNSGLMVYLPTTLLIVIPVILITIGIMGLIMEKKIWYLIPILVGAIVLFMNVPLTLKAIESQVTVINNKLGNSEVLYFDDFKIVVKFIALFLTALSMICSYIYPWTVILIDILFIGFLWAVDYLVNPQSKILPFVFLWALVFAHSRGLQPDRESHNYKEKRLFNNRRILQVISIGLLIGYITSSLLGFNKGLFYDKLWVKANDFLMEDEFMSGNKFLNAFSLKASGYNDSSTKLGGDIKLDDNIVLQISGQAPKYLRGNTKYEYTGKIWSKNTFVYKTENSASTEVTRKYKGAQVKKMTITPKSIRTSSIFVPSFPETIVISEKRPNLKLYYSIKDQTFVLDDVTILPYDVSFYDEDVVDKLATSNSNDEYSDEMGIFLQIPDTVTQRTKNLVTKITEGKNTKESKLNAIKDYLSQNYKYTLTPGDYPEGSDFVDYFLFESKQGYCVHYATAFTIMARLAGIPARYAEGYKVPNEIDSVTKEVVVKNEDGHAWTEVLMDGANEIWTIYDSTGSERDHSGNGNNNNNNNQTTTKPQTKPQEKPKEETKPQNVTKPQNEPLKPNDPKNKLNLNFLKYLLIIPILLLIALAMYLRKKVIKKIVIDDKKSEFIDHIMPILQKVFGPIKDSQSYLDYVDEIDENSNKEIPKDFVTTMNKSENGKELLDYSIRNKDKENISKINSDSNLINEVEKSEFNIQDAIRETANSMMAQESESLENINKDKQNPKNSSKIDTNIKVDNHNPIEVELESNSISMDDDTSVDAMDIEEDLIDSYEEEVNSKNAKEWKLKTEDQVVNLNEYKSKVKYIISENYAMKYGEYEKDVPMTLKEEVYEKTYEIYTEKFGKFRGFIKKYLV